MTYDPHDEFSCCARPDGHDGPCEWVCSDCDGTGRCPLCDDECFCDDVVTCDWCDGIHACPSCEYGRLVDA